MQLALPIILGSHDVCCVRKSSFLHPALNVQINDGCMLESKTQVMTSQSNICMYLRGLNVFF